MGWFLNKFNQWANKTQLKEMTSFVESLKAMDGTEIGFVLANATHIRHGLEAQGHVLLDPMCYTAINPGFTLTLSRTVIDLQKDKQFSDAAAFMVWVHTLRAANTLSLRQQGRNMWAELSRGFPHVPHAASELSLLTGKQVVFKDFDSYPLGLTPTPL